MKVQLRNVRLGFFDLWKPKAVGKDSKEKYSVTLIASEDSMIRFEKADGTKATVKLLDDDPAKMMLSRICGKVIGDKFPALPEAGRAKVGLWCWNKADGSTTRKQQTNDEGEYYGGFDPETWYASAAKRADKAPGGIQILDQKRQPITEAMGKVYSGCYVNAIIDVYAVDGDEGKSCSASLEGIQLLRGGERLGYTPVDAASEFDDEECDDEEIAEGDDLFGGDGSSTDDPF